MHGNSKKAIINAIQGLNAAVGINHDISVKVSEDGNTIDIAMDRRRYIGRVRMIMMNDKYVAYLIDREEGKIKGSKKSRARAVYMVINDHSDAKKFVKWYVLLTQLAAMKRS